MPGRMTTTATNEPGKGRPLPPPPTRPTKPGGATSPGPASVEALPRPRARRVSPPWNHLTHSSSLASAKKNETMHYPEAEQRFARNYSTGPVQLTALMVAWPIRLSGHQLARGASQRTINVRPRRRHRIPASVPARLSRPRTPLTPLSLSGMPISAAVGRARLSGRCRRRRCRRWPRSIWCRGQRQAEPDTPAPVRGRPTIGRRGATGEQG